MNWYPRYYGDYGRDTAHLTLTEHGAYAVLLDHYYATRRQLPENPDYAYRVCRAFAEHEREAVDSVLEQFFAVNGDGTRHNKRGMRSLKKRLQLSSNGEKPGFREQRCDMESDSKCYAVAMASASRLLWQTHSPPPPPPPPLCQGRRMKGLED